MICSTQEDEHWSDACASEETTASETPGGKRDTSANANSQAREWRRVLWDSYGINMLYVYICIIFFYYRL